MIEFIEFIEDMIVDFSEGNDSELNYCYLNEEYGDDSLIDEWGEDWNKGYKDLFSYLEKNNYLDWNYYENENDEVLCYRFELEGNLIKLIFVN